MVIFDAFHPTHKLTQHRLIRSVTHDNVHTRLFNLKRALAAFVVRTTHLWLQNARHLAVFTLPMLMLSPPSWSS